MSLFDKMRIIRQEKKNRLNTIHITQVYNIKTLPEFLLNNGRWTWINNKEEPEFACMHLFTLYILHLHSSMHVHRTLLDGSIINSWMDGRNLVISVGSLRWGLTQRSHALYEGHDNFGGGSTHMCSQKVTVWKLHLSTVYNSIHRNFLFPIKNFNL